ncbi:flagellar hook-length control protein FliK [Amphritea japonica]|uniref:Flagellar hook-length control protein-like C-terminal domain-containing protein n=1 Tax=Amphritea japonica ATCC BAA-1530 TaxID=1278309 RepID=A0A7R6PIQ2_9GAMM|nr:flagellar hook-length control protein FliK [Amphritea japonica]BBB25175.1 hypothetical protein AMJAP_0576 [Amphritea japonica ATCC BAA-1530]
MSQSLSASAGAGSLLSIGTVSATSADAAIQGVLGETAQIVQSFDKSMQQANQQHLPAATKQAQGGQKLPEGGESLPSVDAQSTDEAFSLVKVSDASVNSALEGEEGKVALDQFQQVLFPAADQNFQKISAAESVGNSALQQINKHRDVDLTVKADSALQQVGGRSVLPDSAGENVGRSQVTSDMTEAALFKQPISGAQARSEAPVAEAAPVAGIHNPQRTELSGRLIESGVNRTVSVPVPEAAAGKIENAPVITASSSQSDIAVKSEMLTMPVTGGVESNGVGQGQSVVDSPVTASLLDAEKPVIAQGSASPSGAPREKVGEGSNTQEPEKNPFSESIAQIVRETGLASAQLTESANPVAEAVTRLDIPVGQVVGSKVAAGIYVTKHEMSAKTDLFFTSAESQLRSPSTEVVQPSVRQTAESLVQSGNVMASTQQVAGDLRQQIKTGGVEFDKLPGVEPAARSEGRQEALLTSFADSLTAASKVSRAAAEPMQLSMPNGARPGMPAWGQAVNDRVMMMASKNGQFAEIQLDPPELGSLQVKLQVKNEQVSVVFNTPHGSVREALEQNMPRLREMFAEQGLNLSESSVHDQSEGQQRRESDDSDAAGLYTDYQGDSGEENESGLMQQESLSLVDYYA